MTASSRPFLWLGLVLAALTSLLPVGGVTVCLGHEVHHHGHSHTHSHGLVVAVGTEHQGCVCHGAPSGHAQDGPKSCDRCPDERHECHGFCVARPEATSAEDPVRTAEEVPSPASMPVALAPSPVEGLAGLTPLPRRGHGPPPRALEPGRSSWLERSTVLIL